MKILEDIAETCQISFCFISSKIFNCKLPFLQDMVEGHCILSLWLFMDLTMHFQMGKWRFSIWVNVTFLTYSTCIARSESNKMQRSRCVLLCCEETEA